MSNFRRTVSHRIPEGYPQIFTQRFDRIVDGVHTRRAKISASIEWTGSCSAGYALPFSKQTYRHRRPVYP